MTGTFYVVGVGPGDPELITLKAARVLDHSTVWLAPSAGPDKSSTALAIASETVRPDGKEILTHHFPMKKIHMGETPDPEVQEAWDNAALWVNNKLNSGHDVALPTLGDPAIYCTGFYVCETLLAINPEAQIEIIPGISALGATAAAARTPLCLGNEKLVVIPAVFTNDRIRDILRQFDVVVFMKVFKSMGRLVPLLEELNLLDHAVLVERTSMAEQRVYHDLQTVKGEKLHYFSTLIVRRKK